MEKNFEKISKPENNNELMNKIGVLEAELAKTKKELEELRNISIVDSKTGAFNVNYMNREVPRILNEIFAYHKFEQNVGGNKRRGLVKSVSLAFFDLDGFKRANDKFGHIVIDDLLKRLTEGIKSKIRWGDFLVRHGGDEFALFLLNVNVEEAKNRVEDLRGLIEEIGREFGVTASVGLVDYKLNMGFRNFIDAADKAVLISKKTGKNKITVV